MTDDETTRSRTAVHHADGRSATPGALLDGADLDRLVHVGRGHELLRHRCHLLQHVAPEVHAALPAGERAACTVGVDAYLAARTADGGQGRSLARLRHAVGGLPGAARRPATEALRLVRLLEASAAAQVQLLRRLERAVLRERAAGAPTGPRAAGTHRRPAAPVVPQLLDEVARREERAHRRLLDAVPHVRAELADVVLDDVRPGAPALPGRAGRAALLLDDPRLDPAVVGASQLEVLVGTHVERLRSRVAPRCADGAPADLVARLAAVQAVALAHREQLAATLALVEDPLGTVLATVPAQRGGADRAR